MLARTVCLADPVFHCDLRLPAIPEEMRQYPCAIATLVAAVTMAAESPETAPVRPEGGDFVPLPFGAVATKAAAVHCGERRYELGGAVPRPTVAGRDLLEGAEFTLDNKPLAAPRLEWTLQTPAVAIAKRTWTEGDLRLTVSQTVEYDGFITTDLTLTPVAGQTVVRELSLQLRFKPEASTLYQIPSSKDTPAGFWPREKQFSETMPGIWGGDDRAGFGCYVATFRDWHGPGPWVTLRRDGSGPGRMLFRIISEPTGISAPVTYRFGFVSTPVRAPEKRHWQLYSHAPGSDDIQRAVSCNLVWAGLSDRYATFLTNAPEQDAKRKAIVKEIQSRGKRALAYTTYAHVEEGAIEVPSAWGLVNAKGRVSIASIGGSMADRRRVFCCPGNHEWVEWKLKDLDAAIQRYGVDGFYIDTSYVIQACGNAEHGHGWTDRAGQRQSDFPTWSMREIWRRAYEMLCRAHGHAEIYAHHKGGCPPALAAFTTAFCDGEQFTSQTIKNLTPDAFRAQISGRNMGPLALFLSEYYRSASFGLQQKSEHHNPSEDAMLALLHDVLCTGYPGDHPNRELIALRDDFGIGDAAWLPYYDPGNPWKTNGCDGVAVSAYHTARGDSLLVVGNTRFATARPRLPAPSEATNGRTFVAIDVLARIGKRSTSAIGYRWEAAAPGVVEVPARSFRLFAWVREPDKLPAFAKQHGFASSPAQHARRKPVPEGMTLLDDFEDPDWTLASDHGSLATTDRNPVDTARAMRVLPAPEHHAAALLRTFEQPQDWSGCTGLSFWIRTDREMPLRALDIRLRDGSRYGLPLKLVSHKPADTLPAGNWIELRYEFGLVQRNAAQILRIYFNRDNLNPGPFDLDEMMLHGSPAVAAKPVPSSPERPVPQESKPKRGSAIE